MVVSGDLVIRGRTCSIGSPREAIRAGIAFVPDDRKGRGLVPELSVVDNLTLVHLSTWCRGPLIDELAAFKASAGIAEQLDIRSSALDAPVETLSGGNQQKVVIGKWLVSQPAVFLLDEPTRGIDIGAKAEIYRLLSQLKQRNVGLVIASNELPEILGMCDRIVIFRRGRVAGELTKEEATQERVMELAA